MNGIDVAPVFVTVGFLLTIIIAVIIVIKCDKKEEEIKKSRKRSNIQGISRKRTK